MKVLIVEDDFTSRKLLQKYLADYATCDLAVNGIEALSAFQIAWQDEKPYDLICLDIMMPAMDGQEVLREIRKREREMGIQGLDEVKIIMITALDDTKNFINAFKSQAEAYVVKPVDKEKLLNEIRELGLFDKAED